jgi:hypothetical protein
LHRGETGTERHRLRWLEVLMGPRANGRRVGLDPWAQALKKKVRPQIWKAFPLDGSMRVATHRLMKSSIGMGKKLLTVGWSPAQATANFPNSPASEAFARI